MYKSPDNSTPGTRLHLTWPPHANKQKNPAIHTKVPLIPLFIPFAGCIRRCIFCAQHIQSGRAQIDVRPDIQLNDIFQECNAHIARHTQHSPELAFFGGTFTALPQDIRTRCCHFVRTHAHAKRIHSARCSTRPDAITKNILDELWNAGFRTIELGIQSFHDDALHKAQRHYTGDTARRACHLIKEYGFTLGIQLMPGMPGVAPSIFLDDVRTALACGASFMRFYPCQVIKDTELAALWHRGAYTPWDFDTTISSLRDAWLLTQATGVPVIRMGLAPEAGLEEHILAGPRHPCLGTIVQSEGFYTYISSALQGQSLCHAHLPALCQGFFWGHKKHLASRWKALGIFAADKKRGIRSNITWHHGHDIVLHMNTTF